MNKLRVGFYQRYCKRVLDLLLAIIALLLLFPFLLVLTLLIRITIGTPILFKQKRPGLKEELFTLYKFRTMTDKRDSEGKLLPDKARMTGLGKCLRSLSIDELPELLNIIKGDMSFVGPRPLLEQYLPLYKEQHKLRHSVRPGLTGLAQISGRNSLHWEDKFNLDIEYVNHVTIINDMKIIILTIKKVLLRDGIHSEFAATMKPFQGYSSESKKSMKQKSQLIILGAGGHGRSIADIANKMKRWQKIMFLDDDIRSIKPNGIEVIGKFKEANQYILTSDFVIAIGNNSLRGELQEKLIAEGASFPVLIHPNSVIGEQVTFGPGTVVMAGVIINCYATIGKGCIVNTAASVDHDNVIGDYVHISPGVTLAGTVHIGAYSWLGIGSTVINDVSIINHSIIGAGSLVLKDITEAGTYVGVPIRKQL